MPDRLPSFLSQSLLMRLAVVVLVALAATAGLTYAAGSELPATPTVPTVTTPVAPLLVPDVRNQAFVFAKSTLEEAGFAWLVSGSVRGFSANVVVSQSPAAGTPVLDAGTPRVTLVLRRGSYAQTGEPQDVSPYAATAPQLTDAAGRPIGPAAPVATPKTSTPATPKATTPAAPKATTPAAAAPKTTAAPATPAPATAAPATAAPAAKVTASPQSRPAAFDVPGGRKEPLDEMPLPDRAKALARWLDAHQAKSPAAAKHWLYQNEWIVTGAKLGWWHGADALQTLIAVDRRTQSLWGIGAKSAAVAQQALSDVRARSK
jgi:beta-lactam-binding protein with PASTA domain